jgi:hypothetical protein
VVIGGRCFRYLSQTALNILTATIISSRDSLLGSGSRSSTELDMAELKKASSCEQDLR